MDWFTFETKIGQDADSIARQMIAERGGNPDTYVLECLGGSFGGDAVWYVVFDAYDADDDDVGVRVTREG